MEPVSNRPAGRTERLFIVCLFGGLLLFALWGVAGGWRSHALVGNGFRQTQTAITAMFVQREHNFSLAYPTPVLGKPWSVPFEFPLYQWTVAVVSDTTGLSLIKCGRLVSAACFFLSLPALWLLLRRMGEGRRGRVAALGLVLTCPLMIFYARAFLIETMATMFALWFLAAFVTAVEKRSGGWLMVANVAGIGAGLVKVTTFMVYLVPAALWTAWWLRGEWQRGRGGAAPQCGRGLLRWLVWCAGATVLPFAATYAWVRFSDQVKLLNPGARNLTSSALRGYNFGDWVRRADPAIWAAHWRTILTEILPLGTLGTLAVLAVLHCRGRRLAWLSGCAGLFLLAPAVFPVLYAWHEYYFSAVAVLPMLGAGLVLGAVLESDLPRWRAWAAVLVVLGLQIQTYMRVHRPQQFEEPRGSSDLAEALRYSTEPEEVLLIAGEDWASITPFYAQRRALMLRRDMERDVSFVEEAFSNLAGEPVAALILRGAQRENRMLLEKAEAHFGISPNPIFRWRDALVYAPRDRIDSVVARVRKLGLGEVELLRGGGPVLPGETTIWEADCMTEKQKQAFAPMGPPPLRYLSQFGVGTGQLEGRAYTGAHPTTRIWFPATAGRHEVTVEFAILPSAFAGLRREDATDGVEFVVAAARGDKERRVLYSRLLNPFDEPADRGWQREKAIIDLEAGESLVLETLPGPDGSLHRDWCCWGRLEVR